MHLRRISEHGGTAGGELRRNRNALWEPYRKQIERLAHHFLNVNRNPGTDAAMAEREHAIDERTPTLARDENALQVPPQACAHRRVLQCYFPVTENRSENVVEVVRDSARESSQRLEPLRLAQLGAHRLQP